MRPQFVQRLLLQLVLLLLQLVLLSLQLIPLVLQLVQLSLLVLVLVLLLALLVSCVSMWCGMFVLLLVFYYITQRLNVFQYVSYVV